MIHAKLSKQSKIVLYSLVAWAFISSVVAAFGAATKDPVTRLVAFGISFVMLLAGAAVNTYITNCTTEGNCDELAWLYAAASILLLSFAALNGILVLTGRAKPAAAKS